jgi:ribosomal protein S18 acetylase RimI-like enzyme
MGVGRLGEVASSGVVLRPYRAEDAERIRLVCHQTGFMGEPVGWLWRDRASFAALFCDWWMSHRPESVLVAELDGVVAGYLLGCEDSRRVAHEGRTFFRHFVRRGCALRPGTAGVMWRMLGDGTLDGFRGRLPARVWDERWPAHLHVDLLPECRRRGVGRHLVTAWLGSLRERGVPGCHLQTTAENVRAVAFFEAMGFDKHGPPANEPGFRTRDGKRLHIQLMVQTLTPGPG